MQQSKKLNKYASKVIWGNLKTNLKGVVLYLLFNPHMTKNASQKAELIHMHHTGQMDTHFVHFLKRF